MILYECCIVGLDWGEILFFKMADGDSSTEWELFFTSLLSILNDCESVPRTSLPGSLEREILGLCLEQAVYALQQILSLAVDQGDLESEAFLYELLRNYQLLQIELNHPESSAHCTNIAVYTLESPPVSRTNNIGRPKLEISEHVLLELRSLGFKWKQISDLLLISRWTIRRRVVEFGIQETMGFTDITDAELDGLVQQFMLEHGSLIGCSMISGCLRSLGLRVQRQRVRESIVRVDRANVRVRWASVVYIVGLTLCLDQIVCGILMDITVLLIGDLWFMVLLMVFLGVLYFSSVLPTTRATPCGSFFFLPQITLDGHPE